MFIFGNHSQPTLNGQIMEEAYHSGAPLALLANTRLGSKCYKTIAYFPGAPTKKKKFITLTQRAKFTNLYFIHNLRMGPISYSVCHRQAFTTQCNVTLKLIGLEDKKMFCIRSLFLCRVSLISSQNKLERISRLV